MRLKSVQTQTVNDEGISAKEICTGHQAHLL